MIQRGVLTSQELRPSGRSFRVADADGGPCFKDRWGVWHCDHNHDGDAGLLDLQDCYQHTEGWTVQVNLWEPEVTSPSADEFAEP